MRNVLAFISILGFSAVSFAGFELHSARCLSKDLTLDVALSTMQIGPSVTGKGTLKFQARTQKGQAILGQETLIKEVPMAVELWPSGSYVVSQENGEIFATSAEELKEALAANQPLLYNHEGNLGSLNARVSYINGQKIVWASCGMGLQEECPTPYSAEENSMILDEGPEVEKTGRISTCLAKAVERVVSLRGQTLNSLSKQELVDVINSMMAASWKAEVMEIEMSRGQ